MLFNSLHFLIFFPITLLGYFIIPKRIRYMWLLITSYIFYMGWNVKYVLLLILSTLTTYFCGLIIERCKTKRGKKLTLISVLLINLLILFFFKYFNFLVDSIVQLLTYFGLAINNSNAFKLDLLLPVGISFYTFQAIGYALDVYRGDLKAEHNVLKYALFVSFFPQLVAGPIERSKNLLMQMQQPTTFSVDNARKGFLIMAYGYILKIVIADNIAILINPILTNYENYGGMTLFVALALFAFQIYCDFHGYTQIAIGSAKVLGFDLQENFKQPYLATNIREFWKSWHISLTSWFTDYLYIPLGGNRKGTLRKYINIMIVFLCSGLWHGAAWHFVFWGGLNGFYLICYDIYFKLRGHKIKSKKTIITILSWIGTFMLVIFSWLFFRVENMTQALDIMKKIITDFDFIGFFRSPFRTQIFVYLFIFVILLLIIDFINKKGIDWQAKVLKSNVILRWGVYLLIAFILISFGIYGVTHGQTEFIYFQF